MDKKPKRTRLLLILGFAVLLSSCAQGGEGTASVPSDMSDSAAPDPVADFGDGPHPLRNEIYPPELSAEYLSTAPAIVKGFIYDDAREDIQRGVSYVYYGCTISTLEITEVIKGDLQVGDTISYMEPYYYEDGELIFEGNYVPAVVGETYLFLLDKAAENSVRFAGMYGPAVYEYGKYVLPDTLLDKAVDTPADILSEIGKYSNAELEQNRYDSTEYREIYAEIVAMYALQ